MADRLELAVNQHFFGSSKTAPTNNSVVFLLLYQTRRFHEEDPVVCGAESDKEREEQIREQTDTVNGNDKKYRVEVEDSNRMV